MITGSTMVQDTFAPLRWTRRWLGRAVPVIVLMAVAVASCAPTRPQQTMPSVQFGDRPPIRLDVAQVEVVNDYASPMAAPHVEQFAPTTPMNAVRMWADARLRPVGRQGTLRVVVQDARVTETDLPVTTGVQGVFRRDEVSRYDGRIAVRLDARRGEANGTFSAVVERNRTIGEGATLADRERLLQELVISLARDLDKRLEDGLRDTLTPFVDR